MTIGLQSTEQSIPGDKPRPYWIPSGVHFDSLPEELRAAILEIINPAYLELVVKVPDGLVKSSGMTIVHLMFLEILDQIELGRGLGETRDVSSSSKQREVPIAGLLRLIGAKTKAKNLLLRLHDFRKRWGHFPDQPDPFKVPLEPFEELSGPTGEV